MANASQYLCENCEVWIEYLFSEDISVLCITFHCVDFGFNNIETKLISPSICMKHGVKSVFL